MSDEGGGRHAPAMDWLLALVTSQSLASVARRNFRSALK
jgi:hypothetical protein